MYSETYVLAMEYRISSLNADRTTLAKKNNILEQAMMQVVRQFRDVAMDGDGKFIADEKNNPAMVGAMLVLSLLQKEISAANDKPISVKDEQELRRLRAKFVALIRTGEKAS